MRRAGGFVATVPTMSLVPWRDPRGRFSFFKLTVLAALVLPGLWTVGMALGGGFAHSVLPSLIYYSGIWSLWALLACLAVTPLSQIGAWHSLVWVRRQLGVGALVYALLHVLAYVAIRRADWLAMVGEIVGRWSIAFATVATLGLLALGLTSTDGAVRRLGGRRWKRLQRTVYLWAPLGLLHFLLSPLAVGPLPFVMVGCLAWLLAWRWLARSPRHPGRAKATAVLLGLSVAVALLTAGFEIVWLDWVQDLPPALIAQANFELDLGLSALWTVALLGLAVVAWGRWRHPRHHARPAHPPR